DEVNGTADAVAIHVCLQSFVDFDGLDDVRGNSIEFDLANAGFGGRDIDAVDRGVGKARFGAANLDVFAFAFVTFDRNAGEPAKRIGHVCVRKTANDVGGKNLNDVVGGAFAVDGFDFGGAALRGNDNFHVHGFQGKLRIK